MKTGKVLAAVLNYNGRKNTGGLYLECIKSLLEQKNSDIKVIVIDNNSSDGSPGEIGSNYPEVEIVKNLSNTATMGYNRAFPIFESSDRDYLLLCNNDIIFEPDFASALSAYSAVNESAGYLTPRIMMLNDRKRYNSTGIVMNCSGYAWDRDFGKDVSMTGVRKSGTVFAASGGALFITRKAAAENGIFDPLYHAYYEDVDLSIRLRRKTGLDIHYVADAVCYHAFSMSWNGRGRMKDYYMMRNRFALIMIHFPFRMLVWALRYLIFTSFTKDRRIQRKVFFDLVRMKPQILLRRIKYSIGCGRFPSELLEKYHGVPRL